MAELERLLTAAAREVDWPETPVIALPAGAPRGRRRRLVLAVAGAALAAFAVAMAVPGARSALLRALHLEGVSIVRVGVLPPAEERPLAAALGTPITPAQAEQALSAPVALPPLAVPPQLYLQENVVSALLDAGGPVLLSELRVGVGGDVILKKIAGPSTGVTPARIGRSRGLWISGEEHVYLAPTAPPRLAGNVLLWERDGVLYRLEGRPLRG